MPTEKQLTAELNSNSAACRAALDGAAVVAARDYGTLDPTGTLDSGPTIQAALDKAAAVATAGTVRVELPPGGQAYRVAKPLVVSPLAAGGGRLEFDGRGAVLTCNFAGFALCCRAPHAGLTLGTSLVTGAGAALRCGGSLPVLNLWTEPNLSLSALSAFSVELFVKPVSAVNGTLVRSQFLKPDLTRASAFGIFTDDAGGLIVTWGGTTQTTAPGLMANGTTYHVSLNYDGSAVKLYVAGVQRLTFAASGPVPQLPAGIESVAIGAGLDGPSDSLFDARPDCWIDSVHFSRVARRTGAFTPPTTKHVADADTLLLLNFVADGPHVVGEARVGGTRNSYFLPALEPEVQRAGVAVKNLVLNCLGTASGFDICDVIDCEFTNIDILYPWQGRRWAGSTYGSKESRVSVTAAGSFGGCQVGQSEEFGGDGLSFAASGVPFYVSGAVGGVWSNLKVQPLAATWANVLVYGTSDVNVHHLQIDDEGQALALAYNIAAVGGAVKFFGGLVIGGGIPPFFCAGGGSVQLYGTSLALVGTGEVVHHADAPATPSVVSGAIYYVETPPLSLTPQYVARPVAPLPALADATSQADAVAKLNTLLASLRTAGMMLP